MLKKLSEMVNVKINNYVDFTGWVITEKEVREFINNLTYNDMQSHNFVDDFTDLEFIKYNETVRIFAYISTYDTIVFNIDEIF